MFLVDKYKEAMSSIPRDDSGFIEQARRNRVMAKAKLESDAEFYRQRVDRMRQEIENAKSR